MSAKKLTQSSIVRIPRPQLVEELIARGVDWDEDDTDLELRALLSRALAGPKKKKSKETNPSAEEPKIGSTESFLALLLTFSFILRGSRVTVFMTFPHLVRTSFAPR